jgi:hypothetical protein
MAPVSLPVQPFGFSPQQEEPKKPQLAGSYFNVLGSGGSDFNALNAIEDPTMRSIAALQLMNIDRSERQLEKLPAKLREISEGQFQNYLRFRPYAFGDLVAGQFVKKIGDIPGEIARARQMYGPETATNFSRQTQNFSPRGVVRYF